MRLVGSKTELDFRNSLVASHNALFNGNSYELLFKVLKTNIPGMKTAYFIDWLPEQGEDFYTMLVNIDSIAKIEIDRINRNQQHNIIIISVDEFRKGKSKMEQIKLMVALDLAKKDIEFNL